MKRLFFLLIIALGLAFRAQSQTTSKRTLDVIVSCSCSDTVGKGYARALRDEIARSPRYEEVIDSESNRKNSMTISVVTLAIDDDSQGSSSHAAISVVLMFDGTFIDQLVQTCGASVTSDCAKKTINSLDESVSQLREAANRKQ